MSYTEQCPTFRGSILAEDTNAYAIRVLSRTLIERTRRLDAFLVYSEQKREICLLEYQR